MQRCSSGGRANRPVTFFPYTDVLASSNASCSGYLIVLAESLDARRSNQEQIERAGDAFLRSVLLQNTRRTEEPRDLHSEAREALSHLHGSYGSARRRNLSCKNLSESGKRDMVAMLSPLHQIGAGSQSGKRLKIVNEMGLVEIASIQREVRPPDGLLSRDPLQHLLKALHPAEHFWGESDCLLKQGDEALGTHAQLRGHLRDGASLVPILERGQREPDSRMWCVLPTSVRSKKSFEDANPLVVCPSRLQLLPQVTGGSSEDARKIHDLVRQFGSRHRQKETRPAWLETDTQGRDHGGRINDGDGLDPRKWRMSTSSSLPSPLSRVKTNLPTQDDELLPEEGVFCHEFGLPSDKISHRSQHERGGGRLCPVDEAAVERLKAYTCQALAEGDNPMHSRRFLFLKMSTSIHFDSTLPLRNRQGARDVARCSQGPHLRTDITCSQHRPSYHTVRTGQPGIWLTCGSIWPQVKTENCANATCRLWLLSLLTMP